MGEEHNDVCKRYEVTSVAHMTAGGCAALHSSTPYVAGLYIVIFLWFVFNTFSTKVNLLST